MAFEKRRRFVVGIANDGPAPATPRAAPVTSITLEQAMTHRSSPPARGTLSRRRPDFL